jgi:xanthine dehydrogenase accessory factor
MNNRSIIVVRGGGDVASGTIHRLHQVGFGVIVLETHVPTAIRRTVSFSQAVFDGEMILEGSIAQLCKSIGDMESVINRGNIAVMIDPKCNLLENMQPLALVDGILAKKNLGTNREMAQIVIGLGPGFTAGVDVDAVVETKRGHHLGRVIYEGQAASNTGEPGSINGFTTERVIYSPTQGKIEVLKDIGSLVESGTILAYVNGEEVIAKISGKVRGMIQNGSDVFAGMKIADVDPRGIEASCNTISDKARAVAGGVLEAILHLEYANAIN